MLQVNIVLPIFFLLIMTFLVVFPLFYNAVECMAGLGIIATGLPVYVVLVAWKNKPTTYRRFVGRSNCFGVGFIFLAVTVRRISVISYLFSLLTVTTHALHLTSLIKPSKSLIASSDMLHLMAGTSFLHHSEFLIRITHPALSDLHLNMLV